MKLAIKVISVAAVLIIALNGCVSSSSNAPGGENSTTTEKAESIQTQPVESAPTQASDNEKIVIRFENHGANKHELFSEAVQIFNESQDEVYVDFQTNTTDWQASFWAALAVNDAPDIVTHIARSSLPQYVDAGHLMELSGLKCSSYIEEDTVKSVSYNGGIYAIPVQTEIYGVFYNKDIFERAGITELPTTISELEKVVQQLKPLEEEGIYPFAAQFRDIGQLSNILNNGAAGSMYKSMNEQGLSGEDVAAGNFNFINKRVENFFRLCSLVRENSQPKPEDTDYTTHYTMFANGENAMLVLGNWIIYQMRELNPDINVGMFALPVSEDPSDAVFAADYSLVLNVNAHTENAEAVDKFLSMFCDYTQPTSEFFVKNSLPSGLKDFDKIVTYDAALEAPLAAETTSEFFDRVLPTGFVIGESVQEFLLDKNMSNEEAAELLQKNYDQHIANMK